MWNLANKVQVKDNRLLMQGSLPYPLGYSWGYTGDSRKARTSLTFFFPVFGKSRLLEGYVMDLLTSKVSDAWTELTVYIATHPQRPVFPLLVGGLCPWVWLDSTATPKVGVTLGRPPENMWRGLYIKRICCQKIYAWRCPMTLQCFQ